MSPTKRKRLDRCRAELLKSQAYPTKFRQEVADFCSIPSILTFHVDRSAVLVTPDTTHMISKALRSAGAWLTWHAIGGHVVRAIDLDPGNIALQNGPSLLPVTCFCSVTDFLQHFLDFVVLAICMFVRVANGVFCTKSLPRYDTCIPKFGFSMSTLNEETQPGLAGNSFSGTACLDAQTERGN